MEGGGKVKRFYKPGDGKVAIYEKDWQWWCWSTFYPWSWRWPSLQASWLQVRVGSDKDGLFVWKARKSSIRTYELWEAGVAVGLLGTGTVRSQEAYAFEDGGLLLPIGDWLEDGAQSFQMKLMLREMSYFSSGGIWGKVTNQPGQDQCNSLPEEYSEKMRVEREV